jgi:CRP/FNR family transcriptional regulator, dissimilatory nitrate respiration regulator
VGLSNVLDLLTQSPLFEGVSRADLNRLAGQCELQRLGKRDTLFLQGSPVECFFLVSKGQIKVYRLDPRGERQIVIHLEGPGRIVAAVAAFLQKPAYPASAEAMLESEVLAIPTRHFLALLERNPFMCKNMLHFTAEHARAVVRVLDQMMFREVDSRLAGYLLTLNLGNGQAFKLPTNPEIAAIIGTTPEPVSRKLGHFSLLGWVEISKRNMRILDRAALERLSDGLEIV